MTGRGGGRIFSGNKISCDKLSEKPTASCDIYNLRSKNIGTVIRNNSRPFTYDLRINLANSGIDRHLRTRVQYGIFILR